MLRNTETVSEWYEPLLLAAYLYLLSSTPWRRIPENGFCRIICKLKACSIFPTTWSHKNMYLCALSVRHRFTYLTARFAAVSKRNVHWVALKHRLNTWTLARFYYVDIGTYCCVFIALFQVRTAAVQNSNIRGLSLKVNDLSSWKYALHQTQP